MNSPVKVLLVEDDAVSLMLLEHLVTTLTFEAITASTVAEARAALALSTPHIAILDLMLPDGSGAEVLAVIREEKRPVAVALLTSSHDRPMLYKCEAWKPDAMFKKPLEPRVVAEWLGQQFVRLRLDGFDCEAA